MLFLGMLHWMGKVGWGNWEVGECEETSEEVSYQFEKLVLIFQIRAELGRNPGLLIPEILGN